MTSRCRDFRRRAEWPPTCRRRATLHEARQGVRFSLIHLFDRPPPSARETEPRCARRRLPRRLSAPKFESARADAFELSARICWFTLWGDATPRRAPTADDFEHIWLATGRASTFHRQAHAPACRRKIESTIVIAKYASRRVMMGRR